MVETNLLLSIAFGIISNFNAVVHIPPAGLPQKPEDLQQAVIGSPHSPIDLWLVHKRGDEFWISDGVVINYEGSGSWRHHHNPKDQRRLVGVPFMSSNEVKSLALDTLHALLKGPDPFKNVAPVITDTGDPEYPFYELNWPNPRMKSYGGLATIEIDASRRQVVHLQLWTPEFYDFPFA